MPSSWILVMPSRQMPNYAWSIGEATGQRNTSRRIVNQGVVTMGGSNWETGTQGVGEWPTLSRRSQATQYADSPALRGSKKDGRPCVPKGTRTERHKNALKRTWIEIFGVC